MLVTAGHRIATCTPVQLVGAGVPLRVTRQLARLRSIKLVRHGESLANIKQAKPREVGDYSIPLSARFGVRRRLVDDPTACPPDTNRCAVACRGIEQARAVGQKILTRSGREYFDETLLFVSPYVRARQTLYHLLAGAGVITENADEAEPSIVHRKLAAIPHVYEGAPSSSKQAANGEHR